MDFNGLQTMDSMDSMQHKDNNSGLCKWHNWSVVQRPRRLDPVNYPVKNDGSLGQTLESGPHKGHVSPMMAKQHLTSSLRHPLEKGREPGAPYRGHNGASGPSPRARTTETQRGPFFLVFYIGYGT
eukprot:gene1354-32716_t